MTFRGSGRKLVLAFDIGTTYSGISYSVLDPGRVPEIKGVTKFPSQEYVSGSSKIPTIIYYDRKGKVRAVGAEATDDVIYEKAEEEEWIKAEWFKLHLRSKFGDEKDVTEQVPPLPLNKTVVEVFADFLKYLLACASSYIQTTHPNGASLWRSVKGEIDFVLSHPNGWEGAEQSQLRKAAVLAGLIPDNAKGHARLSFVTEGEASLHFAIRNGLPDGAMKKEQGIVIVDAGGGTIDVSSYVKDIRAKKDTFQEIAAPRCYFHGSIFVSVNARRFLQKFLSESTYIDDLDRIIRCFDTTTKLRFRNANDCQYVRFGCAKDNDLTHNIKFGQLKLSGSDIASFFQPSIECIVEAVQEQRKTAHKPISHVVLVGGFAASDWLYSQLNSKLARSGLSISVPDSHTNKAVSDGAISFYLDRFVRSRIAKFSYGTSMNMPFNPCDPEYQRRADKSYIDLSGMRKIPGWFKVLLPKNTEVEEAKEFRKSFSGQFRASVELNSQKLCDIYCYRGTVEQDDWMDSDSANYAKICTIEADLSCLHREFRVNDETKEAYFTVSYDIVLLFGMTEFQAQVAWKVNGVEMRSPAKVMYLASV